MRTGLACVLVASLSSTLACSVDSRDLLGIADGGGTGSDLGGSTSFGSASGASAVAGMGENASTAGNAGAGDASSGGDTVWSGGSGTSGGTSSGGGGVAAGGARSGGSVGGVPADGCPDLDGNSVPDCQESLVQNPSFDADVAGWVKEPSANETWQSQDAEKRAGSGSLSVQNINVVDIDGSFMAGAKQCLPVTGGKNYVFYVKSFVATGQPGPPQGGFNVQFYNSTDCSGDPLTGRTSNLPDVADSWSVLQMSTQAFSNAHSMFVRLVVLKPFNAQPANVLFDDVLVRAE